MVPGSLHNSDYKDNNDKSDIENRGINNIGNNKLTKINNKILRPVSNTNILLAKKNYMCILVCYSNTF